VYNISRLSSCNEGVLPALNTQPSSIDYTSAGFGLIALAVCLSLLGSVGALAVLGAGTENPTRTPRPPVQQIELSSASTPAGDRAEVPEIAEDEITMVFPVPGLELRPGMPAGSYVSGVIEVPLAPAGPFLDVGTIWTLDAPVWDNDALIIGLRGSPDGTTWQDWIDYDHFHFTDSGQMFAHLVTFDPATRFLQFRVLWDGPALRETVTLQSVRLAFISPAETPAAIMREVEAAQRALEIVPPLAAPQPVVSRTGWGCPHGQGSSWTPQYTQVTHLIVHHTATPNNETDWPARVRSIWHYHAITLGWGDIGYNYLIDPNGVIYEGRAGGDGVIAAHFSCMNSRTMGVALLGHFSANTPNQAATNSLQNLLAWKASHFNINPVGSAYHPPSQLSLLNISGHRDGNSSTQGCPSGTVCPGNVLYGMLPSIRTNVNALMAQPTATPTPTSTPTLTPTPTSTPTPTVTPVGYAELLINHQQLLDAMQRQAGDDLRIVLVIFKPDVMEVYVEAGGITGIVPVTFLWGQYYVPFRLETIRLPGGGAVPSGYRETVHQALPAVVTSALDDLLDDHFGYEIDVRNIYVLDGLMRVGLVDPP
jgi:hypothetical protein